MKKKMFWLKSFFYKRGEKKVKVQVLGNVDGFFQGWKKVRFPDGSIAFVDGYRLKAVK